MDKKLNYKFVLQDVLIIDKDIILEIRLDIEHYIKVMKYKNGLIIEVFKNDELLYKPNKIFLNGYWISPFLFEHNLITQWDIFVLEDIFRYFFLGEYRKLYNFIKEKGIKYTETWYNNILILI